MRQVHLDELRKIQLSILSDVDAFCKEHGIRYSLSGGTLLGAVRHQGYIPWDDDIDLMMPREDYNRFAEEYESAEYGLLDLRKSKITIENWLKVYKKGTQMTDIVYGRTLWGINIDVFPIDGAPACYEDYFSQLEQLRKKLPLVCPFYKSIPSKKLLWFSKYVLKRFRFGCFRSVLSIKKEIEKLACSNPFMISPKAGVLMDAHDSKEIIDRTVFESMIDLPFEGRFYPAIEKCDTYLHAVYGDYMKLPPEEERITQHLYDSFILK